MIILWRLVLAHLLADFTLQTDWVARVKRSGWGGMLAHSGLHLLSMLALTWDFRNDYWIDWGFLQVKGWLCVLLIFVIHNLQDQWRIYTIKKFNTADGTVNFLWDQAVHLGVLFVFSPVVGFADSGVWRPERWVELGILFVLVTHAGTVLLYFIDQHLYGDKFPSFGRKYLLMAHRLLLWVLFLLPGWQWLLAGALWLAYGWYLLRAGMIDLRRRTFYFAMAGTALCGALGRMALLG
ncbi:MAG: DUF3307 domain-containing protein [Elusimicrobia bacterium]|nr:DUF3307 domain-containing protein [Elusimicrobiota bacterium]